jgi:ubiquinone/menaquinone biosynthesis C-methylase UbiE
MRENPEPRVESYYDRHWPKFVMWWQGNEAHAIHIGLYEKGVRNYLHSLQYMNEYVGKLLGLSEHKPMKVLDAGCGVGGPSTHLAQQYPSSTFIGITITKSQIPLAEELAKKREVTKNTQFLIRNFRHTEFPEEFFDGAFAQESINYAQSKEEFLNEMFRVLKPGACFVIIDAFLRDKPLTPLSQKVVDIWRPAVGYPDLISIRNLTTLLENTGFKNIVSEDLTRNIFRSVARSTCIGTPFFVPALIKRFFQGKRYKSDMDDYFFMSNNVIRDMMGIAKIIKFCSVVAIK